MPRDAWLLCVVLLASLIGCESKAEKPAPPEELLGVPVCDEMFAKWNKCIDSPGYPADLRAGSREDLQRAKKAWKLTVATPEGKAQLPQACASLTEEARKSTSSFHCEW